MCAKRSDFKGIRCVDHFEVDLKDFEPPSHTSFLFLSLFFGWEIVFYYYSNKVTDFLHTMKNYNLL